MAGEGRVLKKGEKKGQKVRGAEEVRHGRQKNHSDLYVTAAIR